MSVLCEQLIRECDRTLAAERKRLTDRRQRCPCRLREDYAHRPAFQAQQDSGRRNLEAFERALQFLYTDGGVKPGYLQVRFMRAIRDVCLRRMFGSTLMANLDWLRETRGVTAIDEAVSIIFPRRSGKTTAQCLAAAALAVSQADGNIVCFNLFGRQSEAWLKQTMLYLDIFQKSPEFCWKEVDRHMPERICIRSATARTNNTISAYSGGTAGSFDNKRGMGFKLFASFYDEAGFMPEAIMPATLPVHANGAALILGTSVGHGGPRAGVMRILDAKYPDGKAAIREVNFVRGCGACRAKGTPDRCTHIQARPQHFQRRSDQARLQALMAPFAGAFERELLNVQDTPTLTDAFPAAAVAALSKTEYAVSVLSQHHRVVVLSVDPNGGGMSQAVFVTAVQMPIPNASAPAFVVRFFCSRLCHLM